MLGGGGGGGQGECERRSEAFVKIQNIFFWGGGVGWGGGGTGRIWGVRVDVNEEVTFFVIYLFIFFLGGGGGKGGVRSDVWVGEGG